MAAEASEAGRRAPLVLVRGVLAARRAPWALLLAALAVLGIAVIGTAAVPGEIAAAVLAVTCMSAVPSIAAAIVVVAANDPHLFRDGAFGAVTPVDIAIVAAVCRVALSLKWRRVNAFEWPAIGFLVAGGLATVSVGTQDPATAFARVASYLVLGLAVGRVLDGTGRVRVGRAFVGSAAGQAAAALMGITPTGPTEFPIGRYLGTLGDPAQFGIPVAFAAVFLAFSPHLLRSRRPRYALTALLGIAVIGSATRSAWAVLGTALLFGTLVQLGRKRSSRVRLALAAGGLAIAAATTAGVIVGAQTLGLAEESAGVRQRSLEAAWKYFSARPLQPVGLGNAEVITLDPPEGNPLFASTFEVNRSGWEPYSAHVSQNEGDAAAGRAALNISTLGHRPLEGAMLAVGGLDGETQYTLSIDLKVATDVWLYVDEYDARNQWIAYKQNVVQADDGWIRRSWTWATTPRTRQAKVYVLNPARTTASFLIDNVRLDRGGADLGSRVRDEMPPTTVSVGTTYNTWLAVAISLGIAAAAFLAATAILAPYRAEQMGDRAAALALVAILVPSMTENFVYGASLVTLIWFLALGLAVTAASSPSRASP